jgi:DNA-binding NarL/FixJ family response regulator
MATSLGTPETAPVPDLTPTDLEIIRLLAAGLFNYQIALKVGMSPDAFNKRRGVIHARTGTRTPAQLTATAVRQGWIP